MNNEPYVPTPIVCWNKLPRRIGGSESFLRCLRRRREDLGDAGGTQRLRAQGLDIVVGVVETHGGKIPPQC